MRRTVITAFACLAACYSPDYTQKPCQDDSGCPVSYACSVEKRCMPGVNSSVTDMGTDPRPKRVEVEVRPSGSFYVGTALTDGINDTPSNLRSNPAPFFLDEREVTVADYRACVTAQVCTAPKTGPFGTQGWICSYGVAGKDQHPVTCVTKTQSEDFCKWMGRRLPTEVEWEYAALGLSGAAPTNQRLGFPVALGGNACWDRLSTQKCQAFTTCWATSGKRPPARSVPIPPRLVRPTSSRCAVPVVLTTIRAFPKQRRELASLPKGITPTKASAAPATQSCSVSCIPTWAPRELCGFGNGRDVTLTSRRGCGVRRRWLWRAWRLAPQA